MFLIHHRGHCRFIIESFGLVPHHVLFAAVARKAAFGVCHRGFVRLTERGSRSLDQVSRKRLVRRKGVPVATFGALVSPSALRDCIAAS